MKTLIPFLLLIVACQAPQEKQSQILPLMQPVKAAAPISNTIAGYPIFTGAAGKNWVAISVDGQDKRIAADLLMSSKLDSITVEGQTLFSWYKGIKKAAGTLPPAVNLTIAPPANSKTLWSGKITDPVIITSTTSGTIDGGITQGTVDIRPLNDSINILNNRIYSLQRMFMDSLTTMRTRISNLPTSGSTGETIITLGTGLQFKDNVLDIKR